MRRLCLGGSVKVFFLGSWPPPPPPTSSWCPGLRRLAWARAGAGSSASLSTPCCQHVNISTGRLFCATYRQVEGAGGGEALPPEEAGLGLQVGEVVDSDPGAAHAVQGLALVRVLVVVDELRDVLLLLHQSGHLASVLTLLTLLLVTLLVTLLLIILVTLLLTLLMTILVTMLLTILLVTLLVISLAMQRTSMVLFHRTRNFLTRLS